MRLLQYRDKSGVDRAAVRRLHALTARFGALLIVNDDPAAALLADGLHVGQEDLAALGGGLRERIGDRILGVSCGVPADLPAALAEGADYVGTGPFAATASKGDAGKPIGAAGLAAVVAASGGLPVAAIGGIGANDLAAVAGAGARMAAVISAVAGAPDPERSARDLVERWQALCP